jgi:hypothetical protein
VDEHFRAAFDALVDLNSDRRVEDGLASEITDMIVSLAAAFGYTVNALGELVETPNCNAETMDR